MNGIIQFYLFFYVLQFYLHSFLGTLLILVVLQLFRIVSLDVYEWNREQVEMIVETSAGFVACLSAWILRRALRAKPIIHLKRDYVDNMGYVLFCLFQVLIYGLAVVSPYQHWPMSQSSWISMLLTLLVSYFSYNLNKHHKQIFSTRDWKYVYIWFTIQILVCDLMAGLFALFHVWRYWSYFSVALTNLLISILVFYFTQRVTEVREFDQHTKPPKSKERTDNTSNVGLL